MASSSMKVWQSNTTHPIQRMGHQSKAWQPGTPSRRPGPAIASGVHIAIIEVDSETGDIHILRYISVDDAGRILNRYLVEAQMHGSLAQGIGQALFEEVVYSEDGQNLTGTLMDYALPRSGQLPNFELDVVETPSPNNPLGVKGVGEAGTIAAPPTLVNALLNALSPLGIKTIDRYAFVTRKGLVTHPGCKERNNGLK